MIGLAEAILAVLAAASLPFWPRGRLDDDRRAAALLTVSITAVCAAGWAGFEAPPAGAGWREIGVGLALLASVSAGGPVADAVLRLADSAVQRDVAPPGPADVPADVPLGVPAAAAPAPDVPDPAAGPATTTLLRGGPWIGALERVGVTATLLSGWPQGLLLLLGVKGLGRYPELLTKGDNQAAAERFIIGTFASGLWAAACAAVGLALLR